MITEDYVSFEVAKLLKEKGFDEECRHYLYEDKKYDNVLHHFSEAISNTKYDIWLKERCYKGKAYAVPTLQMAMKWLREVHSIDIWVEGHNKRYKGNIHSEQRGDEALFYEDSYEEACESAIKYCLENLI